MTTDFDRAVDALREIAHIHQPTSDGARQICRYCARLWPCEHAAILCGVEDLTRYGDQPPEQPFRIAATEKAEATEWPPRSWPSSSPAGSPQSLPHSSNPEGTRQ